MKSKKLCSLLLLTFLLCGCSSALFNIDEDTMEECTMIEMSEPALVIGPVTELNLENLIKGAENSYQNVCDSYDKMQQLANARGASKKGKKAAANVEKKYSARILELSEIDFSKLTEDELFSLSVELNDMITAIREARDALA